MYIKHLNLTMRKLVVFLFTLFIFSCNIDDNNEYAYNEFLPIEEAILPDEFERGEVYEIVLSYLRPTTCHAYNDIYYLIDGNERMVAVVGTVFEGSFACEPLDAILETSFNFKVGDEDSYLFKFWQGEDDNGDSQYLIVEVPVAD